MGNAKLPSKVYFDKIYFGASLVAQMIKHLPAVCETWVQSLGQEDPLGKGMATHSMDRGAWRATAHGDPKSWT